GDERLLRGLAMVPRGADLVRGRVIVGDDHAAFARRRVLRRVEGETGRVTEVARFLPVVFGAVGLSGVLDDRDAVFLRRVDDRFHLRRLAVKVDRHDGRGFAVDRGRHFAWIQVVQAAVDVDESRLGSAEEYR